MNKAEEKHQKNGNVMRFRIYETAKTKEGTRKYEKKDKTKREMKKVRKNKPSERQAEKQSYICHTY